MDFFYTGMLALGGAAMWGFVVFCAALQSSSPEAGK